jgi:hypothetical protein
MRIARIFVTFPVAALAVLALAPVTIAHARRISPRPQPQPDYADPPPPREYVPPTPEILYCDGQPQPLPQPPVVVAKPRTWGLGIRASQLKPSADGAPGGQAMGAVLRIRTSAWTEAELDFGRAEYEGDVRRETRLGGAIYAMLSRGQLAPYLLAGGGAYSIYAPAAQQDIGREIYIEGGAGLALRASPRFTITGDVRWTALHWLDGEDTSAASDPTREARLAAILYF